MLFRILSNTVSSWRATKYKAIGSPDTDNNHRELKMDLDHEKSDTSDHLPKVLKNYTRKRTGTNAPGGPSSIQD